MTCKKIVLFYEKHDESSPTKATHEVLLALQQKGHNPTVCLEEPSDESMETIKTTYLTSIADISIFKSFDDQGIKSYINNMGVSVGGKEYHSHKKAKEELSWSQKQSLIKALNNFAFDTIASIKTTLKLMDSISNYCGMDMPKTKKAETEKSSSTLEAYKARDKYMADQLKQQCDHTDDYVIGLLGSSHFDVAGKLRADGVLRAAGVKVQDYYIVESPVEITTKDIGDLCIRKGPSNKLCKDYAPFQGTIYDLHTNPKLDPHNEIIGQVLDEQPHNEL